MAYFAAVDRHDGRVLPKSVNSIARLWIEITGTTKKFSRLGNFLIPTATNLKKH